MPTYTVLKKFTDVKHAVHLVGETIADVTVVPPKLVALGYVQMVPDATPDPDWDARMDAVEGRLDTAESDLASQDERITTLEAIAVDHEERITTLENA